MSTGPISDIQQRIRALPPLKRGLMGLLVIGFLVIGLSFVPAVSARVPPLKSVATTITKAFHVVGTLLSGPRAKAPAKKTSPAQPSVKAKAPTQKPAATKPASTAKAPAKKPAAAKPVATLSVAVKSTPAGATVQLNGRTVGKTPMTLKVAPGTYTVAISQSGYVTMTRIVTVKPGKTASVNVALVATKPPAPATVRTPPPPPPSYERP